LRHADGVQVAKNVRIPMRGGVRLAADLYVPAVGVTGGLWSGGIQFELPGDQRPDEAFSLVYGSEPLEEE
jgi:predicted acyl esterase